MATWPGTLPTYPISDGYQEVMPNNAIRTQMETGLAKVRKRSTAAPAIFSLVYNMTAAQVATLETFYRTTLSDGVEQFTMNNPRTQVSETWRITAPPQINVSAAPNYRVVINMERLP